VATPTVNRRLPVSKTLISKLYPSLSDSSAKIEYHLKSSDLTVTKLGFITAI
jgi:hypothetical protein